MDHGDAGRRREERQRVFEAFYGLTAREIMDATLEEAVFLPPHYPLEGLLETFQHVDHAWVGCETASGRRVTSILLRRDLLRALEPTQASYSRFSSARFRSLAHGSADCICRLIEGRVLHSVAPDTPCRKVLHLMEAKGALYLPIMEGDELVGEIGSLHLLRAVHRVYRNLVAQP